MEQAIKPSWAVHFDERPTYEPAGHELVTNRSLAGLEVQGSAKVGIWHGTMQPGGHAEPHVHTSDQLYVVLRGEVEVGVDGETCVLGHLGTAYMAAGRTHWIANRGDEPAEVLVISSPALR